MAYRDGDIVEMLDQKILIICVEAGRTDVDGDGIHELILPNETLVYDRGKIDVRGRVEPGQNLVRKSPGSMTWYRYDIPVARVIGESYPNSGLYDSRSRH